MMFNRVSADGYFAAPDGNLNWVVPDAALDKDNASGDGNTDTILFGRRTYDMFEQFWPKVRDDAPAPPDPHSSMPASPEVRKFAKMINEATKVVFSTTRKDVTWKNSELRREFNPADVAAMKQQPGNDMIIFGSGSIVSQLTEHGLIDEYQFVISPLLLGTGKQLITNVPKSLKLELLETKQYPSGNVTLRYGRSA